MGSLEELISLGWSISTKTFTEQLKRIDNGNRHALLNVLLDTDLREFGTPWISDHKKQDQLDAGGRIVQLTRSRNIAIPQVDEDQTSTTAQCSGPRLLRLTLTDGRTTISALDVDNHDQLSMNTPPGTKLRLLGTIPLCLGFLILRKQHIQVLGGNVSNLIKEWTMTKLGKYSEGRLKSNAPPFVPFGSRDAIDLVHSECRFLSSLNASRNHPEGGYDSFKQASKSTTAEKENEFDSEFIERRKDIIKEVQQTTVEKQGSTTVAVHMPATMRFQTGGSRFANLQAEKAQAYDEALAQLVSLNYPMPLAASALKIHKGDYKAALDYLLAKQASSTTINGRGSASKSNRRRGGRSGGIPGGPDEEDDPRFDPAAAAAAAGLPSRPSTGLTRLSDLLPSNNGNRTNLVPSASSSRPGGPGPTSSCLPIGCPILAQNMAGEYEEARLIGLITSPGATASGDKVVLVAYTQRFTDGSSEEQEELVPLSLLRTINNEKVSLDMVPPAPQERARAYSLPVSSPGAPDHADNFSNRQVHHSRGFFSRGRAGYSRGRNFGRGRSSGGHFRGRLNRPS